jgi:uncharacterized protein involved in exopolysaccharide biosynthesis
MFPTAAPTPSLNPLRLARQHPLRVAIPALVVAIATAIYAEMRIPEWQASQALVIRNQVAGNLESAGKFRSAEELKSTLETILELSKSRKVLSQALKTVGPPADNSSDGWPTDKAIEQLGETVKLTPPKGAEYGKTEVFYLVVKDPDRERAVALATALCDQLEARHDQLRKGKAQGMISELAETVQLARADAEKATEKVAELEEDVGSDLAELRGLHLSMSSESGLRRKNLDLENELRQAQLTQQRLDELVKLLTAAEEDQSQLLAMPNSLLESQPALRRLKEGLVDAQLSTAKLRGTMSDAHPQVKAALAAELEINHHLRSELATAVKAVDVDLRLAQSRVTSLEEQLTAVRKRLERLAGLRAEYSSLVAESDQRTKLLSEAEKELSEAQASQASAQTASLIGRVDTPDTGTKPIGPGKRIIQLAGLAGGIVVGFGVLLLTSQPTSLATVLPEASFTPTVVPHVEAEIEPAVVGKPMTPPTRPAPAAPVKAASPCAATAAPVAPTAPVRPTARRGLSIKDVLARARATWANV